MEERILVTAQEVAAILGLSKAKVYTALKDGTMPGAVHIGGNVRVHRQVFVDWLARQSIGCDRADAEQNNKQITHASDQSASLVFGAKKPPIG